MFAVENLRSLKPRVTSTMNQKKLELVDNLISNLGLSRNEVISYLQTQATHGSVRRQDVSESETLDCSLRRPYELSEYQRELYDDIGGDAGDFGFI